MTTAFRSPSPKPQHGTAEDASRGVFRLGLVTMSIVILGTAIGLVRVDRANDASPRAQPSEFRPSAVIARPAAHVSTPARGAAFGGRSPG